MRVVETSYPLSPIQQGMLFHHLSTEQSGVDIEQIVGLLPEKLDVDAFRRAWQQVAKRHPPLRTAFRWDDVEEPLQDVYGEVHLPVQEQDWRELTPELQASRLEAFLQEDRQQGFELLEPPLSRVALFRISDDTYRMVWSLHHIIMDGRSFAIVLRDVFERYKSESAGTPPAIEPAKPFEQHIEWLQARDRNGEEAYWRRTMAGYGAASPLPIEKRVEADSSETAQPDRSECEFRLSRDATDSLQKLAEANGFTLNTLVQGAWSILLSRYSGEHRIVFGATRAGRKTVEGAESIVGCFIATVPVAVEAATDASLIPWLKELREQNVAVRPFEHTPLVDCQRWSDIPPTSPMFGSNIVFDRAPLGLALQRLGGPWEKRDFKLIDKTNFPLTLYGYSEPELSFSLVYDGRRFEQHAIQRMLGHLGRLLEEMAADPNRTLGELELLTEQERKQLLVDWNATQRDVPEANRIHTLFEAQAQQEPDRIALVVDDHEVTYGELNQRANRLARHLQGLGVGPDELVGVCTTRSAEMMVGLLGILKAGGAYVPLDPEFPAERLEHMLSDSKLPVLLTEKTLVADLPACKATIVTLDDPATFDGYDDDNLPDAASASDLAYVIYTSGSTGQPKGVLVEHRNVANFFAAMDDRIAHKPGDVWLAVTSLSFDISVLELLWTLGRGLTVVVATEKDRETGAGSGADVNFSLFYFASDEGEHGSAKYRLLLEGAKFADANGLHAIWTPERHFHAFGGLYPNPSVAGAAIASITSNVKIRSGSCVLPLHSPIRVAEEWSLVDNLSDGRVGISFAAGWQPNDFVLAPDNYADRKEGMFREIETVRKLWRGETVGFPNHKGETIQVQTLPRPVQAELPVWVTTAGNADTYRQSGRIGAHVLTHLLGQTVEELGEKIAAYHAAWRQAGHKGHGTVSLMLHTFIGADDDEIREVVREPMKNYLRSSVSLIKGYASSWTAFKQGAAATAPVAGDAIDDLSPEEMEGLLDYGFERYYETSGLFGTPAKCQDMVERLIAVGVDEIACLIDFGVSSTLVLEHLSYIVDLQNLVAPKKSAGRAYRIPELLETRRVTHMQCTPSMARMMLLHEETRQALGGLKQFLIGGEALPVELVSDVRTLTQADIVNMYGPTETTIWSSTHQVNRDETSIPIGRPIANTELYVLDPALRPQPVGVTGELYIGGAGVVRGYLNRSELTAERFVPDPFSDVPGSRLYRTGDLVRYREDGKLEFLGRTDTQVKLRGYRIELGEIEAALRAHPDLAEAAVLVREDVPNDRRLVAYVVAAGDEGPSNSELRTHLQRTLPDYMMPATFVTLQAFPLTPNAKIDRKALPAPSQVETKRETVFVPPTNELEHSIANVWKEILHLPKVGVQDNFFDLGGHSLLAVQLHGRLRKLSERELSVTDVFRFPTVRSLTEYLSSESTDTSNLQQSAHRAQSRRARMSRRRQGSGTNRT